MPHRRHAPRRLQHGDLPKRSTSYSSSHDSAVDVTADPPTPPQAIPQLPPRRGSAGGSRSYHRAPSPSKDSDAPPSLSASFPPQPRKKAVHFDLAHTSHRTLPRDSGKCWKKIEKMLADAHLDSPIRRALSNYYICENRNGEPMLVVAEQPDLADVDEDMVAGAMEHDDDSAASSTTPPGDYDASLRLYRMHKLEPAHPILHYPEDRQTFVDQQVLRRLIALDCDPEDAMVIAQQQRLQQQQQQNRSRSGWGKPDALPSPTVLTALPPNKWAAAAEASGLKRKLSSKGIVSALKSALGAA